MVKQLTNVNDNLVLPQFEKQVKHFKKGLWVKFSHNIFSRAFYVIKKVM